MILKAFCKEEFSSASKLEIVAGIVVFRVEKETQKVQLLYSNSFSVRYMDYEVNDETDVPIVAFFRPYVKDFIRDGIMNRELELEHYRLGMNRWDSDVLFLHIYENNAPVCDLETNIWMRPQKMVMVFDEDFRLQAISPKEGIEQFFELKKVIGKKCTELFSDEAGLTLMDGFINARKSGKERVVELHNPQSEELSKMHFRVAYASGDSQMMYYASLDYFPKEENSGTLVITIDDTFRKVLDDLPNVVIIHRNGKIIYSNKEASILSGVPMEKLIGSEVFRQIVPEYHQLVREKILNRQSGTSNDHYEIEVYGPKQERRVATVRSSEVIFNKEKANLVILHDVSERKKLEEALRQGKEEIETIMNTISSGVIIVEAESKRIKKVNRAAANLIGLRSEEIIGRECHKFICPNEKNCCPIEQAGHLFENSERKLMKANGACIPILKTVTRFLFEGVECYLESFVDISEIKENEKIIQRKEKMLLAIAELTDELLKNTNYYEALQSKMGLLGVATGVDRVYLFENDMVGGEEVGSCSQKIEWSSESAVPQIDNPELQNVPLDAIEIFMEPLRSNKAFVAIISHLDPSYTKEALEMQDIKSILVLPLKVNDKLWGFVGFDECKYEREWSEAEFNLLMAFAGTLSAAIERRELERNLHDSIQKAQDASKAKSEFLANMSHEIRTPLNAVIGFTELLLKTNLNEVQNEYMHSVNNSANILLELLNDILDYSKIEAGKLELYEEKVDLFNLFEQIADIVKFKAHEKNLEFLLSLPDYFPQWVVTDVTRLRQVLINLLWNSVKFTEKGEIELSMEYEPCPHDSSMGEFRFSVRDTGIGINKNRQEDIFHAFVQADASTTRKYGGTGLGLPITINILQKMNSALVLESEEGLGSIFSFTLSVPIVSNNTIPISEIANVNNILVVDDNHNNLKILHGMLHSMNIESTLTLGAEEALASDLDTFDGFIIDYNMPEINGLELASMIKDRLFSASESIPIIILYSSANDVEIRKKARDLGIKTVLSKPVNSIQLQRAILYLREENTIKAVVKNESEAEKNLKTLKGKVLIAEDNLANMKLAESMIRMIAPNITLDFAKNGREAVNKYIEFKPDLVLMDVQMPEMNGMEATEKIRVIENERKHKRVSIVALTAGAIAGTKELCLEAGMDDFLYKPLVSSKIEQTFNKFFMETSVQNIAGSVLIKPVHDHFNQIEFTKNVLNNMDLYKELMEITRETFPKTLADIEKAWADNDFQKLKESSHAIKGHAFSMCCKRLAELAKEVELKSIAKESEGMDQLVNEIKEEVQLLLNQYLIS